MQFARCVPEPVQTHLHLSQLPFNTTIVPGMERHWDSQRSHSNLYVVCIHVHVRCMHLWRPDIIISVFLDHYPPDPLNLIIYLLSVCAHVCAFHSCLLWRSEDNFWESVLYFYHVDSKDRTQVVKQETFTSERLTALHRMFWDTVSLCVSLVWRGCLASECELRDPLALCPPRPQPLHSGLQIRATMTSSRGCWGFWLCTGTYTLSHFLSPKFKTP